MLRSQKYTVKGKELTEAWKKRRHGAKMWLSVSLLWAVVIMNNFKSDQLNPNQKWQKDEPKPTTSTPVSNYTHSSTVMLYLVSSLGIFTAVPLLRVLDMSQCLGKWAERNPKPQYWVRGALTVSASCKSKKTGRGWCLHFPACLGFGNWHGLQCRLQALAGGHRSEQEADWGDCKGFNNETGPHHHSLTLTPAY